MSRNMEALIKEADRHGPHHRTAKAWCVKGKDDSQTCHKAALLMLLAVWVCRRYILEYLGMKEVNEDVVSTGKTTGEGTHTHRHTTACCSGQQGPGRLEGRAEGASNRASQSPAWL